MSSLHVEATSVMNIQLFIKGWTSSLQNQSMGKKIRALKQNKHVEIVQTFNIKVNHRTKSLLLPGLITIYRYLFWLLLESLPWLIFSSLDLHDEYFDIYRWLEQSTSFKMSNRVDYKASKKKILPPDCAILFLMIK